MIRRIILFTLPALLLHTHSASADVIWVPDDYNTIHLAVNATSPGDTVMVRPGTYDQGATFPDYDIVVMSEYGADSTIVSESRDRFASVFSK